MSNTLKISLLTLTSSLALLLCGCQGDDDTTIETQRTAMITYMEKVLAKDDLTPEGNYNYQYAEGVYRYVSNMERADYGTAPVAAKGDLVHFWFSAYRFKSDLSNPLNSKTMFGEIPVYSNEQVMIDEFTGGEGFGLYWPREVMKARLGSTDMIKGLTRGLRGCRQGDSAVLLITSNLAYGDDPVSTLPEDTPMAFRIIVEKVEKQ